MHQHFYWHYIDTQPQFNESGYRVPCAVFTADDSDKTIIVLPALGIRASFYEPLAVELVRQGFNAVLFEQRGYGKSQIRPTRTRDWGFKQWVEDDIPAVYGWVEQQFGDDVALLGHSLGGHMAMCYTALNHQKITKLILSACGSPWLAAYTGVARFQVSLLYHLIPPMNALFGYYNGKLMGFGGREARGVMRDWRHLAKSNTYRPAGINIDVESNFSLFQGTVLNLRYLEDDLAPLAAVEAVLSKFSKANITRADISSADLTVDLTKQSIRADHFSWARTPNASVTRIKQWWS